MGFLKRFRILHTLKHHPIPDTLWHQSLEQLSWLHPLSAVEKTHLRELSTRLIRDKRFTGVGIEITPAMQVLIAICASLPILHLGLKQLEGWEDIVVYPSLFVVERDEKDACGVMTHQHKILGGEAWQHGPVILAWQHLIDECANPNWGRNVVIHEIAHKLDFLNGSCNGMPPLHPDMPIQQWTDTLSRAFAQMQKKHPTTHGIDPYAATSPAEFFAVCSEYFFCHPQRLQRQFSGVYAQLQRYYRQNPLNHCSETDKN